MLRDLRVHVSLEYVECLCIVEVLLDVLLGYLRRCDAFLLGSVDDLVVNVGEVLYELDLVAPELEIPPERIENDKRSGISYVEEVIYGRAADIHPDLARLDRYEFFFSVGKSVVDLHSLSLQIIMNDFYIAAAPHILLYTKHGSYASH